MPHTTTAKHVRTRSILSRGEPWFMAVWLPGPRHAREPARWRAGRARARQARRQLDPRGEPAVLPRLETYRRFQTSTCRAERQTTRASQVLPGREGQRHEETLRDQLRDLA